MRKTLPVLLGLLLLIATGAPGYAQERRIALLIGNQAYDATVGRLANPHNDIELVAGALREQGFEILPMIKDAGRSQMLQGVRQLVSQLNAAGAGSVGFVYYSGHGAAERETATNYLIPIDAREPGTTTFWDDSLKLDDVLRLLERASNATKFVIFDACRNELRLPTRDTSKGLVRVTENHGLFVAYSAAPGQAASDRGEGSGPYAAALAAELRRPGLDHLNLFQNVKEQVISATGGAQHPWESNGLARRVYLTRPTPAVSGAAPGYAASAARPELPQTQPESNARVTPALPALPVTAVPPAVAMAAPDTVVRAVPRTVARPRCDDGERLVNGRCVEVARPKRSKVREAVLKRPPVRVRSAAPERERAPVKAAAPRGAPRMCFNSSSTGRGAAMVPCDDPRAMR